MCATQNDENRAENMGDLVTLGDYYIQETVIEGFILDQGHFAIDLYELLSGSERSSLVRDVGRLFLELKIGIKEVKALRNAKA